MIRLIIGVLIVSQVSFSEDRNSTGLHDNSTAVTTKASVNVSTTATVTNTTKEVARADIDQGVKAENNQSSVTENATGPPTSVSTPQNVSSSLSPSAGTTVSSVSSTQASTTLTSHQSETLSTNATTPESTTTSKSSTTSNDTATSTAATTTTTMSTSTSATLITSASSTASTDTSSFTTTISTTTASVTSSEHFYDPYRNARRAGLGSFFCLMVVVLLAGTIIWVTRKRSRGGSNLPFFPGFRNFGQLPYTEMSPPPPPPPGNFRFAMGPTNNSSYDLRPQDDVRQRSSNRSGFDPFDPRSTDFESEGQFVNKTDNIEL